MILMVLSKPYGFSSYLKGNGNGLDLDSRFDSSGLSLFRLSDGRGAFSRFAQRSLESKARAVSKRTFDFPAGDCISFRVFNLFDRGFELFADPQENIFLVWDYS